MKTVLIILFVCSFTQAAMVRTFYDGVRATGMGNAFVSIADDGDALWYNPAGLARLKKVTFNFIDANLSADSMDTVNRLKRAIFDKGASDLLRTDTQFARLGLQASFFTPYFGLALFDRMTSFMDVQNLSMPDVDMYSINDIGVIAGLGLPIGENFSIGVAAKVFERIGVNSTVKVSDLLNQFSVDPAAFLAGLRDYVQRMYGSGYAVGFSAGTLWRIPLGARAPKFTLGAAVEDIADTYFDPLGTSTAPQPILMSIHLGSSLRYQLANQLELNLALDGRNLFAGHPLFQTVHFGIELRHRFFSLRTGVLQAYPTFGFSFTLHPHTQIHFSTYAMELGDDWWQRSLRVYMLQIKIGFNPI
ncbi:MAG: hypothetical protein HY537_07195 [Deltaproteobacteria bacterium]|nr:hypothetical protein [Deltaproteobacteria bacterium]